MKNSKKACMTYLDARTMAEAKVLGKGNLSAGVRRAFSFIRARPSILTEVTDADLLTPESVNYPWVESLQRGAVPEKEVLYKGNHRSVYLGADEWLIAKDLGHGNISAGIRAALLAARLKLI